MFSTRGLIHLQWLLYNYWLKWHRTVETTPLVLLLQCSDLPITQTVKFSITQIHLVTYRHCNEVTETPVIFFAVEQMLYFCTYHAIQNPLPLPSKCLVLTTIFEQTITISQKLLSVTSQVFRHTSSTADQQKSIICIVDFLFQMQSVRIWWKIPV